MNAPLNTELSEVSFKRNAWGCKGFVPNVEYETFGSKRQVSAGFRRPGGYSKLVSNCPRVYLSGNSVEIPVEIPTGKSGGHVSPLWKIKIEAFGP